MKPEDIIQVKAARSEGQLPRNLLDEVPGVDGRTQAPGRGGCWLVGTVSVLQNENGSGHGWHHHELNTAERLKVVLMGNPALCVFYHI